MKVASTYGQLRSSLIEHGQAQMAAPPADKRHHDCLVHTSEAQWSCKHPDDGAAVQGCGTTHGRPSRAKYGWRSDVMLRQPGSADWLAQLQADLGQAKRASRTTGMRAEAKQQRPNIIPRTPLMRSRATWSAKLPQDANSTGSHLGMSSALPATPLSCSSEKATAHEASKLLL